MGKTIRTQPHQNLFENIKAILHEARSTVARNINTTMVMTYFEVGRVIVVDEQQGKRRAGYAEETLKNLSLDLTREFGKGFSVRNLENMRKFYVLYSTKIPQAVSAESRTVSSISAATFSLSWSHYVFLIRLTEDERKSVGSIIEN